DFVVSCAAVEGAKPIGAIGNTHTFVAERIYSPTYPYPFDPSKCGASDPNRWLMKIRPDLVSAYSLEHAYMQEHDKYAAGPEAGFMPELPELPCFHWVIV